MAEAADSTLLFRVRTIERELPAIRDRAEKAEAATAIHQEQINGAGGLVKAVEALGEEVKSLKRAIYTVGGSIVVSAFAAIYTIGPPS